jgi:hypothetical protein
VRTCSSPSDSSAGADIGGPGHCGMWGEACGQGARARWGGFPSHWTARRGGRCCSRSSACVAELPAAGRGNRTGGALLLRHANLMLARRAAARQRLHDRRGTRLEARSHRACAAHNQVAGSGVQHEIVFVGRGPLRVPCRAPRCEVRECSGTLFLRSLAVLTPAPCSTPAPKGRADRQVQLRGHAASAGVLKRACPVRRRG